MKQKIQLIQELVFTHQMIQDFFKKVLSPFGLNFKEYTVLEMIYHEGKQPIQKLGRQGLATSSNITYIVDKLEKKDLVERKPCINDRRVIYACITDKGKGLIEQILPVLERNLTNSFQGCSAEEINTCLSLLNKLEKQIS